jgi:hypothetical protein
MNWCVPATLFVAITFSISKPPLAQAQDASSLEQLQKTVQLGDTLLVTDKSGKLIKGKVEQVSGTSLGLKAGGRRLDFAEADIVEIKKQRGDSLANGALIGALAVGAPVLVLAAATSDPNDICCSGADAALVGAAFAGVGAGVGALVDALHKHKETVYSSARNQTARFYVGPMITSSRKGVQFAIRF